MKSIIQIICIAPIPREYLHNEDKNKQLSKTNEQNKCKQNHQEKIFRKKDPKRQAHGLDEQKMRIRGEATLDVTDWHLHN